MGHTFTQIVMHIVFGTRERLRCIDPGLRAELYPYCRGIVRALRSETIEIGGSDDHIHMLVRTHPSIAIADLIGTIKSNSSKWVHEKWPRRIFGWQAGYSAFSVDRNRINSLARYIRNQEEHHSTRSFRDEYRDLLRAQGIVFDERFLLD